MQEILQVTLFTLGVSLLGTLLVVPPGMAAAWVLARRPWPGRALVTTVISLPLYLPPVATGLILLDLCGRRGPLGRLWAALFGADIVFTWRAVVLATAAMGFPLFVRAARAAFEGADRRLEETARTLGAGPWDTFLSVSLPLASRGLGAAAALAFARGLGEFGATVVVAGLIPGRTITLALGIYQDIQLGDDGRARVLLLVSGGLALAATAGSGILHTMVFSPGV